MARSLKIAISGCGVAGLATAAFLRDQGHSVTVYDQFQEPRAVGSGLIVQPTGQTVLAKLGILPRALACGVRITHMEGHRVPDDRQVLFARYGIGSAERFGLGIHRAALFEILLDAAISRGVDIELGSMVLGVDFPREPYLKIEGGRDAGPFDLVVDATGARSAMTPMLRQELAYGALWGVIDLPDGFGDLGGALRQKYDKAHRMAGILPIGHLPGQDVMKAAVFWSLRQDEYADWRERNLDDWKAETYALWPDFEYLISGMERHDQLTFATYAHGSIDRCYSGRIAFVGDAAHQTSPQLGQGANHALIDAMTLADALAEAKSVERALALYSRRRRLHVKTYQLLSRVFTPFYQSDSAMIAAVRDRVFAPVTALPLTQRLVSRIVSGDVIRPHGLRSKRRRGGNVEAVREAGE